MEKGYIAVGGASLTVVEAREDAFTVSLVRHTQEHTTLAAKAIGDPVNLEVDILGKYIERFTGGAGAATAPALPAAD